VKWQVKSKLKQQVKSKAMSLVKSGKVKKGLKPVSANAQLRKAPKLAQVQASVEEKASNDDDKEGE
jgi:hypothetical protein